MRVVVEENEIRFMPEPVVAREPRSLMQGVDRVVMSIDRALTLSLVMRIVVAFGIVLMVAGVLAAMVDDVSSIRDTIGVAGLFIGAVSIGLGAAAISSIVAPSAEELRE